jgi:hypothetical protein
MTNRRVVRAGDRDGCADGEQVHSEDHQPEVVLVEQPRHDDAEDEPETAAEHASQQRHGHPSDDRGKLRSVVVRRRPLEFFHRSTLHSSTVVHDLRIGNVPRASLGRLRAA